MSPRRHGSTVLACPPRAAAAFLLATALLLGAGHATAGEPTGGASVEVEDQLCRYAVEFDRARISEERVRGFLRLGEQLAGNWVTEYDEAERNVWMAAPDEVASAIPRMKAVLARFDAEMKRLQPPRELAPVVRFVRHDMEFDIWLGEVEVEYCKTDDAAVLRRRFHDLDPATLCAAEIDDVKGKWFGRCKKASFTWGNCVNGAFRDRLGDYPRAAWEAFLRAHGIRLRKLECDEP